jgi:predicted ATP-grasp superfamily ATP-dependent carboligase
MLPPSPTNEDIRLAHADPVAANEIPATATEIGTEERPHSGRVRLLMIATDFTTPYRVLRCANAGGADVYVLGNSGARPLRFSRYCKRVLISGCVIHGARDEALALEINCLVRELGIFVVIPADAPAARALIASRDLIAARCFPLPTLEHFDLLNNKWSFARLCTELGIRQPSTRLVDDAAALARDIASNGLANPLIVKPLDQCANAGVIVLDGVDTEKRLNAINYQPVLVQDFVSGSDIGAGVYARAGRVEAFIAHWLRDGVYATFQDKGIYDDIAKIVRRLSLDGVYNFDMLRTPDGSVYFLECNPRFFYKINLSMIAGINFVACGVAETGTAAAAQIVADVQVRFPKAMLRSILSSGRCTKRDWEMACYMFSDPWPYLMEKLNLIA